MPRGKKRAGKRRRGADIDITPLIDVLFMLIIFFVLTTAFTQGSIDVALPRGSVPPPERNPVVLTVAGDAKILWAGRETTRSELPSLVRGALERGDDILLAGDRSAPYGEVAELLAELRSLGVPSVGIAFQTENQ